MEREQMPKSGKIVPYDVFKERLENRPPKLRRVGGENVVSLNEFKKRKGRSEPAATRELLLRQLGLPPNANDEEILRAMINKWKIPETDARAIIRQLTPKGPPA